jgi:hypothetical protein
MKSLHSYFSSPRATSRHSAARSVGAQLAAVLMAVVVVPHAAELASPVYLNGGIGKDDVRRMETASSGYPLRLEFSAGKDHEFLADAQVRITDLHGRTVFEHADAGPILLVKLPPGDYRVTATATGGRTEEQTVKIGRGSPARVYFHWDAAA